MTAPLRKLAVTVVTFLSLLGLSAGPAAAQQYPPATGFGVACATSGDELSCAISGAAAGEELTVTAAYGATVFFEEIVTADAGGEVAVTIGVPAEAQDSEVMVTVSGTVSGTVSTAVDMGDVAGDVGEPVAGVPVPAVDTLPMTGGQVGVLLVVALVLIGAGLLALRRREDARVAA